MEKEYWADIETGDIKAYSEVYVFYYKKLYNYGRKFTQDISMIEDSVNEVFIMIWTNRQKLAAIRSPHSYIFSSFRNNIFKKLKADRTICSLESAGETEIEFSIDTIIISKETDAARQLSVQKALAQLTPRQKEAIFLRFYEGLPYEEIAGIMNISVKATYKIMARALKDLKNILGISLFALLTSLTQTL
ncbi:MAG TPA: RNA polymerase sigma factor [Hanamia sp.]|nr:RNA polymerase sigma factor [Hanamia sp.]